MYNHLHCLSEIKSHSFVNNMLKISYGNYILKKPALIL